VKVPKAPSKVPNFLTREHYDRLMRALEAHETLTDEELSELIESTFGVEVGRTPKIHAGEAAWMADVVTVASGTGLRSGEIRSMRWDWIDLGEGTITIQETRDFTPKNGDERTIYVSGDALAVLRRRFEESGLGLVFASVWGSKIDKDYLGKRFRFFRDLAKLPKEKNFHSTRHTYASWLVQAGVDLYRVQKLCGHKSMATTMRYAHLAPKNLRDAVELAFGS
jgi:integrase